VTAALDRTSSDPLALPFDQYQRYRLVSDLLGELRATTVRRTPLRVLDVGGRTGLLRRFLDDPVTLVDLEPAAEPGLVLGDGGALPFADASFDVVAAFDTLEHVPPSARSAFVSECRRVARSWVVLAGPYHSERVAEAEELLKAFLREKLGVEHRYLDEHRAHGLPDRARVTAELEALGGRVASFGHANMDRWLVAMCLSLYLDEDPALRPLAAAFHRFYNASLYASDHAEPVYRHAVVAAFGGAALPRSAVLAEPPRAPSGTLHGLRELVLELVGFDRERGEWRAERARLRRVAADLERDLAGHRASLTQARERVRELSLVEQTLAVDLAGHRDALAEAREELAARAEALGQSSLELERERRLGEESRQALVRDLAEHRAVLASQGGELALLRAAHEELIADAARERGEAAAVRAELERRLAEHRASLEGRERELAEHREVLAAREREQAELRRGLTELEAALASERAQGEQVRAALQADLEGHRGALAELRGLAQARGAEIERLAAEIEARGNELGRVNQALERADEQRRELAAEVERRGALLRSRWESLKRAIGPRRER
jgi:hypothetical protein